MMHCCETIPLNAHLYIWGLLLRHCSIVFNV